MTDVKEEMKRIRRLNKEARMKAKGTWKNNSEYLTQYSTVVTRDAEGKTLPAMTITETIKKEKKRK